MDLNDFNLTNFEKFDAALNIVNSLNECNISNSMGVLKKNSSLPKTYAEISSGIEDLSTEINRLASGEGPEKLIDNYKNGYNEIKNAIINAYIAEYNFALENKEFSNTANSLKNSGQGIEEKIKSEFSDILSNMSEKNNNTNLLLQYSSLTEFFNEVQSIFSGDVFDDLISEESKETLINLQPKNNSDIAHRGYTPGHIYDNSAEGFILAGQNGFWGCETDVRFDENGNLVCSHNAVENGQNPTTFEEYLDICKEYGMTAIIDLKYEKGTYQVDTNLSPEILKIIEEKGMMDSCILQTNNANDISYIRENSEEARIWYLTDVVSDKNIKLISENNVECVNIQSSENNAYRINKLTEQGIDVCVWNVQTEATKQKVLDTGAKYVMSDNVLGISPYQEGQEDFNKIGNNIKNNTAEEIVSTYKNAFINAIPKNNNESATTSSNVITLSSSATTSKPTTSSTSTTTNSSATTSKPTTSSTSTTSSSSATTSKPTASTSTTSSSSATPSKPTTSSTSTTSSSSATTSKPTTSSTSTTSNSSATTSKPTTSSTSTTTNSSATTSKPTTSSTSTTTNSSATTSKPVTNILPDNKLSAELPPIPEGMLGTMEISKSHVNYNILDINEEVYNKYLHSLQEQGYVMNNNGFYSNGKYEVLTTYSNDGSMNISLKVIE